jgi:predicted acyltransferase (DUF342 family)
MSENKGLIVSNISGSERGTIHSDAALIAVTGAISIAREATNNAHRMPGTDVAFHVAGTPNDNLTVSVFGGDVVISGSLNVKGDLIAQSEVGEVDDLIVDGTLTVNESTLLKGRVDAEQDVAVTGSLVVLSDAEVQGKLEVGDDLDVAGRLTVTGSTILSGNVLMENDLEVIGTANFNDVNANDASVQFDLSIGDDLRVANTLTVTGSTILSGNVLLENDLEVQGMTTMGSLTAGDVNVLADLDVDADARIAGDLTVTGSTILSGNVLMENDLDVLGTTTLDFASISAATVQNNLDVGGDSTIAGVLTVTGSTILSGNVLMENDLNVLGTTDLALTNIEDANVLTDLDVGNDVRITGNLTVTGSTILSGNVLAENDLEVLGTTDLALTNIDDANILTDLDVGNNVRIAGDLTVTGSTILSGNVLMENDLDVLGSSELRELSVQIDASIGNDLRIAGNLTVTGSTILSGSVLMENDLEVIGSTTLSSLTADGINVLMDLDVDADVRIAGDLTVTGSTILSGNVLAENDLEVQGSLTVLTDANVQGDTTLASALVLGDLEVQQDADVKGNLYVTGTLDALSSSRLVGDVLMEGDLTVEGGLVVTGSTTLVAPLLAESDATVAGNLEVQGDVAVPNGSITVGDEFGTINVGDPNASGADVLEIRSAGVLRLSGSVQLPLDLTVTGSTSLVGGLNVEGDVFTTGSNLDLTADVMTITISGSALIRDVSPIPQGLVYADDYEDTFINESLVTKRFVNKGFVAINQYDGVVFVDSVEGDDDSALPYRIDLPFRTITAAIAASATNDTIRLRPGTYAEWGLVLPNDRTLEGDGSFDNVFVGSLAATSNVLTIGKNVTLQNISFFMPSAGHTSIVYAAGEVSTDRSSIYRVNFIGDGTNGTGVGFIKSGSGGRLIGSDVNCSTAGYSRIGIVSSGVMTLDNLRFATTVPADPNVNIIGGLFEAQNNGRLQISGLNCGSPNIQYVVRSSTTNANQAPIIVMFNTNCVNAANFAYIGCDGTFLGVYGGKINTTGLDFVFDAGLDGVNDFGTTTTLQITAAHQSKNSFPFAALASEFGLSYFQERTTNAEAGYISVGTDNVVGFGEFGSAFYAGRGRPYNAGSFFYTTDGTASASSDGGNLTDVTTAASSRDGSTFGFQGTTAGHSILFTTPRQELGGGRLRYFGIVSKQVTGSTGGSYVFEIKTGANEWTPVRVEAVSVERNYRYANNVFLRSGSEENIIFGIDADTAWPEQTIGGITGRWARVRIATNLTTGPTFQQWKLVPSNANFSSEGYRNAFGLAKWKKSLTIAGSVFSEIGSVTDATLGLGTGGVTWSHPLRDSSLSSTSLALGSQIVIPNGLCTAFPINVRVYYFPIRTGGGTTSTVTASAIGRLRAIPLQASNIEVADPAGGITTVNRLVSNTELLDSKSGTSYSANLTEIGETVNNAGRELRSMMFGPFNIDAYYEGDALFFIFDITNLGTLASGAQTFYLAGIDVEGIAFSDGRPV